MLEIIATSIQDVITINNCGAGRIELVSGLTEGGLTPSYSLIKQAVRNSKIPINVMIRPHANSFVYSTDDLKIMLDDIQIAKDLGANGVVLGCLDHKNHINQKQLDKLLTKIGDIQVVFHKAIDQTPDIKQSLQIIVQYPQIDTILTSAGKDIITNNINQIKQINNEFSNFTIMLGGGLNLNNINLFKNLKNVDYHFGTAVRLKNSCLAEIDNQKLIELINIVSKF